MNLASGAPMWAPDPAAAADSRMAAFQRGIHALATESPDAQVPDYEALLRWSVDHLGEFWDEVWRFFDVAGNRGSGPALAEARMPGARWFPGARLNYAAQALAERPGERLPDALAILADGEPPGPGLHRGGDSDGGGEGNGGARVVTWAELRRQVGALARTFTDAGVRPGDRVVAYLPDTAESVVAFLAAAGVGAVWAACGQDYAPNAALDRLGQLEPTVLVAADGYLFAGKEHDRRGAAAQVRAGLPSVRLAVRVPRLAGGADLDPGPMGEANGWQAWAEVTAGRHEFEPVDVAFDHPLWVVFSSGTTGKPKGIVHGHGGVVLEHLKTLGLHLNLGPGDVFWWYTSPSWMMWNYRTSGLLVAATIVTYDGSPAHPTTDQLWRVVARHGVSVAGTSPGYLLACEKAGVDPAREVDLSGLRTLGCTGSTVPPESYTWVARHVGERVQFVSTTGGTDVVTGFAGGSPTVPVWAGELSVACLGVALEAFDDSGHPVRGGVGELVVTKPMPSMPVSFWNDPEGERYRDAYFSVFPGVWRHGDWITITDRHTVLVHGRSDSTLNRHGVRMGSAEIYRAVEQVPEVAEALVVGVEEAGGGYWMPLFVTLVPEAVLDDDLKARINHAIRTIVSPRHVPDEIILAPGVPHTRTGKKLEIPVKRLFAGDDARRVADLQAVDDPAVFAWFENLASDRRRH